jgi:hypothetical protein
MDSTSAAYSLSLALIEILIRYTNKDRAKSKGLAINDQRVRSHIYATTDRA